MKITHCILSFNTGGSETMLIDIMNEQVKQNDVSLVIVNHSYQDSLLRLIDQRVKVVLMNRMPGSRNPWAIAKLNWLLWKLHADVIHIHSSSLLRMVFISPKKGLFMTVHALQIPLKGVKQAKCLFAISDAVAEDVKKRCDNRVVVIKNGIVTENILRRECRNISGNIKIINVARLDMVDKGQDILIKAIAILNERGVDNIDVAFIGAGPSEKELKDLVIELGLESRIHFLGLQNRKYIYEHLKDYDLMCHPSRHEGFGLTVAEGIAAKLPVLVSSGDGPAEIILQGKLGYVFENDNANDCANKIEYIINNYSQALNMTDKAYDHICQNYSVKRMVNQYCQIYQKS